MPAEFSIRVTVQNSDEATFKGVFRSTCREVLLTDMRKALPAFFFYNDRMCNMSDYERVSSCVPQFDGMSMRRFAVVYIEHTVGSELLRDAIVQVESKKSNDWKSEVFTRDVLQYIPGVTLYETEKEYFLKSTGLNALVASWWAIGLDRGMYLLKDNPDWDAATLLERAHPARWYNSHDGRSMAAELRRMQKDGLPPNFATNMLYYASYYLALKEIPTRRYSESDIKEFHRLLSPYFLPKGEL